MASPVPEVRPVGLSRIEWGVLALAAVLVLLCTRVDRQADTACSRLATVFSLVEYGSFYLDTPDGKTTENPFANTTVDRVMVRGERVNGAVYAGRMISSKPPVLPLLMATEYAVLRPFSWDLRRETDAAWLLKIMTLTFVGFPLVVSLAFFTLAARKICTRPYTPLLLLVLLVFGTQYAAFGLTLNNHVPATAAVIASIALALHMKDRPTPQPWGFLLMGLLTAVTFTLDMPATLYPALIGVWIVLRYGIRAGFLVTTGAVPLLALHFGLMMAITGSPLPVQMRPELYLYPESAWRHPIGVDAFNLPLPAYLFHMTFGWKGIFTLYPVLILGLAGFIYAILRKGERFRAPIIAAGLATALLLAYYTQRTNNFGGDTFGMRWLIVSMPVLLLMAAPVTDRVRGIPAWLCMALLLAISTYTTVSCARHPWQAGREWTTRILSPCPIERPHK